MHETRTLAQFVAQIQYADLPSSLIDECKIAVLDTFGAGFVGALQPWAQRVVELVRALGGTPEASIIHQAWQTDISRAALANGALIGAFECEPLTGSHASGTVFPAALAVCEREHCDGKAFLAALAVGFEVSARIARTAVGLESVRGFHNPGTQGPFGATVAVGKLYGCDQETLVSAMGLAGSCSAGLLEFAWSGADTKRLHLGRASQLGLESALLARQGLRGPATVLEGRYGYFNAFSMPPKLDRLVDGLGTDWAIQPPSLKFYATHVTHQAVVQAIQDFQREHPLQPQHITRVVIRGAPRIMEERHTVRAPESVMGGQYSLLYTPSLYVLASERLKSKPGNMARGTDGQTLDGFSLETIQSYIALMRTEHYQPTPVRRTDIPKGSGKWRPLGVPSPRDKIVHECVRLMLEAIYEPTFHDNSHGFRLRRSCHTALESLRRNWMGTKWVLKVDIAAGGECQCAQPCPLGAAVLARQHLGPKSPEHGGQGASHVWQTDHGHQAERPRHTIF